MKKYSYTYNTSILMIASPLYCLFAPLSSPKQSFFMDFTTQSLLLSHLTLRGKYIAYLSSPYYNVINKRAQGPFLVGLNRPGRGAGALFLFVVFSKYNCTILNKKYLFHKCCPLRSKYSIYLPHNF